MYLRYSEPSARKSIAAARNYLDDLETRSSDMRPFLKGLEEDIIQNIKHEFDQSNPNKWQPISQTWREAKQSEGFPENIGIFTGSLLKAASDDAVKAYYPTGLTWKIADVYSIDFTLNRKIGITTGEWLRTIGKKIAGFILGR
jgi:hypothetical protein